MGRFIACIIFAAVATLSPCSFAAGVQNEIFALFLKTLNRQINGTFDAQSMEFIPPSSFVFQNVKLSGKNGKQLLFANLSRGLSAFLRLFLAI